MNMIKDRLRELRTERGLTQPQVADALEISRATYANWEQGRREPDANSIILLCNYFKVSADYLIGLKDE